MLALYIHIPFCNSICSYCDFPKQMASHKKKEEYIDFLINEIDSKKDIIKEVNSIYIGGGTPNSLDIKLLEKLFIKLEQYLINSKENTIEINSELLTLDQVKLFKKYNINRVSIGVQTTIDRLIKKINRHHNLEMIKKSIELLHENHIQNINLDMMYGLPDQKMEDVIIDIDTILSLGVKHISYYSLILEDKTVLNYQLNHNQISLPDDDLVADMANLINQKLKMNKFNHYEISNYSLDGYQSIHNICYWKCDNYLGFGASAASLYNNRRYQNELSLNKYYKNILYEDINLSLFEAKQEFMMLGLRMLSGININEYFKRFKSYPNEDFDIDKLLKLDLIEFKNDIIRLKEDKYMLANIVFEEFVG